ncbi:MAG: GNAT family N-acetyltransferase [Pseudomonadota bacterium]
MNWTLHPWQAFEQFEDRWQALCEQRYFGHPLLDVRWVRNVLKHFADDTVKLAVADGPIEAMAIVSPAGRLSSQTFTPSQIPMAMLIADTDELDASSLARLAATCRTELFAALHFDDLYHPTLSTASAEIERVPYATTMSMRIEGSFEAYWQARAKNLRGNVRRYFRFANEDDLPPHFAILSSVDDVVRGLARYGDIESRGWKAAEGTNIHIDNEQGHFYRDVLSDFAATGAARVFEMSFGDMLVGSFLVIQSGTVAVLLKTTYDEEYKKYAPGRLLLHDVLKAYFEDQSIRDFEFYTKANKVQLQWSTHSRPIDHVNVYRRRPVAHLHRAVRSVVERVRSRRSGNSKVK